MFKPNSSGSYDALGSVETFPNIEAYHWQAGKLLSPYLFRLQNFSEQELESDRASFWTGVKMYDFIGRRTFMSRTIKEEDGA